MDLTWLYDLSGNRSIEYFQDVQIDAYKKYGVKAESIDLDEVLKLYSNIKLASWIKNIKRPYLDENFLFEENLDKESGYVRYEKIGIKPHDANDGYGHAIQIDE